MKLRHWLFINRVTVKEFAALVPASRWYVFRWMNGDKPSQKMLDRVIEITKGKVGDFEDLADEPRKPRQRRHVQR